jgi:threonine/homoserine/homoserine lactone efflux protein
VADLPWALFIVASAAVIIAPGQDLVLVFSRSLSQGPAAGVVTAAGVSTGLVGHTILVSLGLGAVVQASPAIFLAIKIAGALYLVYLGMSLLRASSAALDPSQRSARSLSRLFADGAISNIANPKIVVFYLAFLPQFVGPSIKNPGIALFALGFVFASLTFLIKGPIGFFAGKLSAWFRKNPVTLAWIYRCSGLVLLGMALRLVFESAS